MSYPNYEVTVKVTNDDSKYANDPHCKDQSYSITLPINAASEEEAIEAAIEKCKSGCDEERDFTFECTGCEEYERATPGQKKITLEEFKKLRQDGSFTERTSGQAQVSKNPKASTGDVND